VIDVGSLLRRDCAGAVTRPPMQTQSVEVCCRAVYYALTDYCLQNVFSALWLLPCCAQIVSSLLELESYSMWLLQW